MKTHKENARQKASKSLSENVSFRAFFCEVAEYYGIYFPGYTHAGEVVVMGVMAVVSCGTLKKLLNPENSSIRC